jgi:hypothetical protein
MHYLNAHATFKNKVVILILEMISVTQMFDIAFLADYSFIPFQHTPFWETDSNTKVNPFGRQAFFLISLNIAG